MAESSNNGQMVVRRSVSMYEEDWRVVDTKADEIGGNSSLALRLIVREWSDYRKVIERRQVTLEV